MKILIKKFYLKFFPKKLFYINDQESLKNVFIELEKSKLIAIDTEFDWRNTYFPILSVMQIATEGKIFIIDFLEKLNLEPLKNIMLSKKIKVIFHAARSDTTVLSKCFGLKLENVFDVQVADKIINNCNVKSYASLVKENLGIELDKSETNSNWLKRPLSEDQIKYCAEDVNYLIEIYKIQKKILLRRSNYEKALMHSKKEALLGNMELKDLRIKKNRNFSKSEAKIFLWREKLAIKKNIPPSYIFKDKQISYLSKIKENDKKLKQKLMSKLGDTDLVIDYISKIY